MRAWARVMLWSSKRGPRRALELVEENFCAKVAWEGEGFGSKLEVEEEFGT